MSDSERRWGNVRFSIKHRSYNNKYLDLEVTLEIILSILLPSLEPHETIPSRWAGSPASTWGPGWGFTTLSGCLVHDGKLYLWEGQHMVPSFEIENESSAFLPSVTLISKFPKPSLILNRSNRRGSRVTDVFRRVV